MNRNSKAGSSAQHPRALRPGQRLLQALAGRDDELFVGLVRGRPTSRCPKRSAPRCAARSTWRSVKPGDRVLEIGCGWGALAEMAAFDFGASVTGVTLSHRATGLCPAAHRLALRPTCGCRTTATSTTRRSTPSAPSRWWKPWAANTGRQYFQSVSRLLKPGGRACVQSIVIDDQLFDRYIDSTDFIQQYIFPGGCLPCPREFRARGRGGGARSGGRIRLRRRLRRDAAALARRASWRSAATSCSWVSTSASCASGSSTCAYCEAAFSQANIDVVQYTLRKR
jgi:cyclopropane-fatty-acyl-phospholipid synthase